MQRRIAVTLMLILTTACQQAVAPDDEILTIEESILSGDIDVDSMKIPILSYRRIAAQDTESGTSKTAVLPQSFDIEDWILLAEVSQRGGAAFSGTIRNHAANPVDLDIRLHYRSDLSNPETEGVTLGRQTMDANSSLSLNTLANMDSKFAGATYFFQGSEALCIYFLVSGDPDFDVSIEDLALECMPAFRSTHVLAAEEYGRYAGTHPVVNACGFSGSVNNTGSGNTRIKLYASIEKTGFWPGITPPLSDRILIKTMAPGQSADAAQWSSDPAEDALTARIIDLIRNQHNLWITTVITSETPLSLSTGGWAVEWSVAFGQ